MCARTVFLVFPLYLRLDPRVPHGGFFFLLVVRNDAFYLLSILQSNIRFPV